MIILELKEDDAVWYEELSVEILVANDPLSLLYVVVNAAKLAEDAATEEVNVLA